MGLIEFALVVSVIVALYNLQQIKMILKDKGFSVDLLSNPLDDHRNFKGLIEQAPDEKDKIKYQKILNGLYLSLGGFVFCAILMIRSKL